MAGRNRKGLKTRQQIEEELLAEVQVAQADMRKATGKCQSPARKGYQQALKDFNEFVLKGKLPDQDE